MSPPDLPSLVKKSTKSKKIKQVCRLINQYMN